MQYIQEALLAVAKIILLGWDSPTANSDAGEIFVKKEKEQIYFYRRLEPFAYFQAVKAFTAILFRVNYILYLTY